MILATVIMTIKGNTAKLDKDLYLYRDDKNVTIKFRIVDSVWTFTEDDKHDILKAVNATHFTMRWMTGTEVKFLAENQPVEDGVAVWNIENDLIDEALEVGDYDCQITLHDEDGCSCITLPPVLGQIHVGKHIFKGMSEVGDNPDGMLPPQEQEPEGTFDESGFYNKTEWTDYSLMTPDKLNKIEDAIDQINTRELRVTEEFYEYQEEQDERLDNLDALQQANTAHDGQQDERLDVLEGRADDNDTYNAGQDERLTNLENRADNNDTHNEEQDGRLSALENRANANDSHNEGQDTRLTNLETDSARKEVLIQALLNEETDKVVTVEADGNEKHLDYAVDDWMVKLNKIEGRTLVNVCDEKGPIPITKSYTVNGTNHVPLQGEYDGSARPVVYGNTLVNRANGVQELTVLPEMELQGNNEHNIDGVDGAKVEVANIKGKTMVNLFKPSSSHTNSGNVGIGGRLAFITMNSNTDMLIQGNTYTVVIDFSVDSIEGEGTFCYVEGVYWEDPATKYWISKNSIINHANGMVTTTGVYRYLACITLPVAPIQNTFHIAIGNDSGEGSATCTLLNYGIFEGDLTQTLELIPAEYVEGLKSSFEYEYASLDDMNIYDYSQIQCSYYGSMNKDYCVYNCTGSIDNMFYTEYYCENTSIIKPSTEYTVVVDIIDTTLDQDSILYVISNESGPDNDPDTMVSSTIKIQNIKKGRYVFKCQSLSDISQSTCVLRTLMHNPNVTQSYCRFKITLLEGDQTSIANKYQAEVKTVGKNKFNKDTAVLGSISVSTGEDTPSDTNRRRSDYIPVLPNTPYTISQSEWETADLHSLFITQYDSNKVPILFDRSTLQAVTSVEGTTFTFTTFNNARYIKFRTQDERDLNTANIQIEEGTEATEYEPYKEATHVVYLNSPLLEGDELVYKDGQLCHYHKMGKVVLDGSEDWLMASNNELRQLYYLNINWGDSNIICDKLLVVATSPNNKEIYLYPNGQLIYIGSSYFNLSDFKQWLQENPTTIVHQLATPWYEPIGAYRKVVLDGSENWTYANTSNESEGYRQTIRFLPENAKTVNDEIIPRLYCNKLPTVSFYDIYTNYAKGISLYNGDRVVINNNFTSTDELKQWLQENPVTVIYELANPNTVKEPIAIDVFNNSTLTINSNVPVESTVTNYSYRLEGFSEPYTLNYKANGEVTHEIVDNKLTLYGDKVKVSDIMLVDGENTPTDRYFKGMQSVFEDGYIPNNLLKTTPDEIISGTRIIYSFKKEVVQDVTVWNNCDKPIYVDLGNIDTGAYHSSFTINPGSFVYRELTTSQKLRCINAHRSEGWEGTSEEAEQLKNNIIILEGNWTHLTEEDLNHLGQYKVEYKVTGKNICANNWVDYYSYDDKGVTRAKANDYSLRINGTVSSHIDFYLFSSNKDLERYVNNAPVGTKFTLSSTAPMKFWSVEKNGATSFVADTITIEEGCSYGCFVRLPQGTVCNDFILQIQLEEGSQATSYEPYKESIKTFYLNTPLLEGDTIEEINGVATHVHRYEKVVLRDPAISSNNLTEKGYKRYYVTTNGMNNTECFCDRLPYNKNTEEIGIRVGSTGNIGFTHFITDLDELKQWLSENPTTVVYKLATPWNEPLEPQYQGSILCDSYVNGHLDFDSAVPVEKVVFGFWANACKYAHAETSYIFQFEADNPGKIDLLHFAGVQIANKSVNKGLNRFKLTTGASLPNTPGYYTIRGIGFNASNIQVVEADENVEFDYFEGLSNTYESELVTDENDENYGKYRVEYKVTGKNKFDGELMRGAWNNELGVISSTQLAVINVNPIKVKPQYTYTISNDFNYSNYVHEYDSNMNYIGFQALRENPATFTTTGNTSFINIRSTTSEEQNDLNVKYQIEEGTQATPYEPYKEYTKIFHLNSPLLQGDTIEEVNGNMCHVHRYGKVVLDGSEDWNKSSSYNNSTGQNLINRFYIPFITQRDSLFNCDRFKIILNAVWATVDKHIETDGTVLCITLNVENAESFKQWLSENPTTVVYKLASPIYEPIEPEQGQLLISSVKEGDLSTETAVPIKNMSISYTTCVPSALRIETELLEAQTIQNEQDALLVDLAVQQSIMNLMM